ncbi:MAG: hypothetical protein ABJN04_06690 [Hyphomicrobiales bacterium]
MADFDDITGWEEELRELKQTDRWKKQEERAVFPPGAENRPAYLYMPKLRLSEVKCLAELLLGQEHLHNIFHTIQVKSEAVNRNPDLSDQHPDYPPRPEQEMGLLLDITTWYALKEDMPINNGALAAAVSCALGIANSKWTDANDPKLLTHLKKSRDRYILFDE